MATIKSALVLQDKMTSVMRSMISTLNATINGFEAIETAGNKALDPKLARQMRVAVGEANAKLSEMEKSYEDAANGQNKLNKQISQGSSLADGLAGKIKSLVAGYAGMKGIQALANLSDEMAQTEARINLMNDGLQTTDSLMSSIYQSAQRSRGSYTDMAAVVAKFGNNAKDAFSSSQEVVAFSELVQKQMKIAGASGAEASNAMLQLSQALGSGVLRGDELNSIFEQAPNLIQSIADYMKQPIGNIRKLASEGKISADIVKNAMFAASDEINKKFAAMPMTWSDAFTSFKNKAIVASQPVLDQINALANNKDVQKMMSGIASGIATISKAAGKLLSIISKVYSFFAENWGMIAPIIGGIAAAYVGLHAAVAAYNAVKAISNGLEAISAAHAAFATGAKLTEAAATTTATGAQVGLNAALLACPVTWVVAGILAIVAALYIAIAAVNKFKGTSYSATGIIAGAFAVLGARLYNHFVVPTWNSFAWLANFVGNVFTSPVAAIKGTFYSMCTTVLGYINNLASGIEAILNAIPGVSVNITSRISSIYDSLKSASDAYNAQSGYKEFVKPLQYADYKKVIENAYTAAAGLESSIKDKFSIGNILGDAGEAINNYLGGISNDTGSIAKSLNATNEELSWIRDLAEREVINRFTTAEVKVDMTGMTNEISSDVDVDGLFNRFVNDVSGALRTAAAGVN